MRGQEAGQEASRNTSHENGQEVALQEQEVGTTTIPLRLSAEARGYDIIIRPGLVSRIGAECQRLLSTNARLLVITDTNLADNQGQQLMRSLREAGFEAALHVVPAGETSKSLAEAEKIVASAMEAKLSRKDAFIAFGGGVVGDLAGFCASVYHRGTRLIQVPTTLVAQVDSAIGGKTAVNFGRIKNIVGTFHQPLAVLADPLLLDTLPARERTAGLAEVAKYGLIETSCTGENGFFDWLLSHAENPAPVFAELIARCVEIKATVVMNDEQESKGLRFFLNLGHTFGHAYETMSNYELLHGEAVAIGLMKAARLSERLGLFESTHVSHLERLLDAYGLTSALQAASRYAPQDLLACMRQDKKNDNARIRLILPQGDPGSVVTRDDIPDAEILAVLKK